MLSGRLERSLNRFPTGAGSVRLERDGAITDISDATYTQTNRQQDFGEPGREGPCRTVQTLEFEGTATAVSTRFMPGIAMITAQADGSIGPEGFWGEATLAANLGDRSTMVV